MQPSYKVQSSLLSNNLHLSGAPGKFHEVIYVRDLAPLMVVYRPLSLSTRWRLKADDDAQR